MIFIISDIIFNNKNISLLMTMANIILMLNLRIGLNEEQYLKLRNRAESNRSESIEEEIKNIIESVIT